MKAINKNRDLIKYLSGEFSLLSSKLYKIDIYNDAKSDLIIDLYLELLYAKGDNRIKLAFTGIEEFSFYHHHSSYFYNVERYKLLEINDRFYLCLDPSEEVENISTEDQNFILSRDVYGFFI
ncbi:hypothetical protein [Chitinophaga sp. 212800010-3]|uniref:hypothetical protein n=1 Tax=unclassified Chitinophaga TaxID=2619133 RepID=UPI002DF59212|nr:Glyco-hydro-38C domain-containing protein [Chitinophaga sp. 212800010-3]